MLVRIIASSLSTPRLERFLARVSAGSSILSYLSIYEDFCDVVVLNIRRKEEMANEDSIEDGQLKIAS